MEITMYCFYPCKVLMCADELFMEIQLNYARRWTNLCVHLVDCLLGTSLHLSPGCLALRPRQPAAASGKSQERRVSYAPLHTSRLPSFVERDDRSQCGKETNGEDQGRNSWKCFLSVLSKTQCSILLIKPMHRLLFQFLPFSGATGVALLLILHVDFRMSIPTCACHMEIRICI